LLVPKNYTPFSINSQSCCQEGSQALLMLFGRTSKLSSASNREPQCSTQKLAEPSPPRDLENASMAWQASIQRTGWITIARETVFYRIWKRASSKHLLNNMSFSRRGTTLKAFSGVRAFSSMYRHNEQRTTLTPATRLRVVQAVCSETSWLY